MKLTVKHLLRILYGGLALSILVGFFVHFCFPPHRSFFWERLPIFSALYGFIGCLVIILGSKALGHHWLQKDEDYYEKQDIQRSRDS